MPTTFDNVERSTFAGLEAIHVGKRLGGGYMGGFAGLLAADTGDSAGMRLLQGAEIFPFTVPDPVLKPILGANGVVDEFAFASTDVINALLEFGIHDDTFNDASAGIVKKTVGIYDFHGRGDSFVNQPPFMILAHSHAHNKDSGDIDASGWRNELWLSTKLTALGAEATRHQEPGKSRLNARFTRSNIAFWGELLSVAMSVPNRLSIYWYSEFPSMVECFVGDGTIDDIPVAYAPVSVETSKVWDFTAGTLLTVSAVSSGGLTITTSAAPADGHICQVLYQTPTVPGA